MTEEISYQEHTDDSVRQIGVFVRTNDTEELQKFCFNFYCEETRLTRLKQADNLTILHESIKQVTAMGGLAEKTLLDMKNRYESK